MSIFISVQMKIWQIEPKIYWKKKTYFLKLIFSDYISSNLKLAIMGIYISLSKQDNRI
jgi:hypothetical protein